MRLEKRFKTLASEIDCVEQGILDLDFVVFPICRGGPWRGIVYETKKIGLIIWILYRQV